MINLLPPQLKEELFKEQRYRLLLILGVLAIVFLVALSLALFSVKTYISGKARSETIFFPAELQDSEKEIQKINSDLQKLSSFYEKQPDFTGFMEKISKIFPKGIHPTSLALNSAGKDEVFSVSLRGISQTRESLLQLKKNIDSEPGLKDVYFPLANLVQQEDIEFNVSFKIEL